MSKPKHECDTCCVVDQHCDRSANWDCGYNAAPDGGPPCKPLPVCYPCGQPVCRKCSSIRKYLRYGMVRMCNNCQIEYDGNSHRVMHRIARLAGYSRRESTVIVQSRAEESRLAQRLLGGKP